MQTWPELNIPPQAAALAARSMSASREHDHRVLAAELEADRGQRLGGAGHHLAAGPVGAGELDEVDVVDEGAAGLAGPLDDVEDVRAADLVLPGLDHLGQPQRRELRRLDDDRGACLQRRDRVAEREDQREVPGADDPDHRMGPVLDAELLRGEQGGVGTNALLADELGGVGAVEVDRVGQVGRLVGGVGADLAGLRCIVSRIRSGCRGSSRAACPARGAAPRSPSPPSRAERRAPAPRSPPPPRARRPAASPASRRLPG